MRSNEHIREASVSRARPDERAVGRAQEAEQPSATDAVERVFDAGQRLITERIELAKLDVQEAVTEKVSKAVLIVVPGMFAFGGWWILMAALVAFLNMYMILPASLAIVGGAHVAIGGGIAASALKRGSGRNGTTRRAAVRNGGTTHAAGARP
jgi:hypothetical protein